MAWINPRYRELTGQDPPSRGVSAAPEAAPEPPAETGRRLASLPRPNREGRDAELRVSLDEYQGHPFVSVRLWEHDPRSGWWPVKGKGVSVRIRECEAVAAALRQAIKLAGPPQSAGNRQGTTPADLPPATTGGPKFDEFAE